MPEPLKKSMICMVSIMTMIGVNPVMAMGDIREYMPHMEKVGEARMKVMMWDIYDAVLFAPNGSWNSEETFVLQLKYLRHLDGQKIADRAVYEMRFQGVNDEKKLAIWHTQMRQIIPDVYENDILTGVFIANGDTIFFANGTEIGRIADPEFSKHFSAIWLGRNTSAPEIRKSLLGLNNAKGQRNYESMERINTNGTNYLH